MKKLIHLSLTLLCLIFAGNAVQAQLLIEASLENIVRDNDKVSFEIFLKTQNSSAENLYLDGSDFVITFDASNFSNPVIRHTTDTYGGNKFEPMNNSVDNIDDTRNAYYNSSSLFISGNSIVINVNNQSPNNSSVFANEIAQIDNQSSVHSLGVFELTGIIDSALPANFAWDSDNIGLRTVISSLESVSPFDSEVIPTNNIIFNVADELLPTELVSFETSCEDEGTSLTWTTASEINSAYTLIQKSGSDLDWKTIETIQSEGPSFDIKHYAYEDKSASEEISYYRLVFVDLDGKTDFSNVEIANCHTEKTTFRSFPNPASKGSELNVEIFGNDKATDCLITDVSGKLISSLQINSEETVFQINIPEQLSSGMYIVQIHTMKGNRITEKLFIQ